MYCPNRDCPDADPAINPPEYVAGIENCPKCQTRLVALRPWEPGEDYRRGYWHDYVTVASFLELTQAHLVCGGLRWRGIDAVVMDESVIALNWNYGIALGGVKVKVRVEDEREARALLAEDWSLQPGDVDYSDGEAYYPPCPRCASRRIHHTRVSWLSALPVLWIGMAVPLPSKRLCCESCGYKWRGKLG